jgi:hypothetical protein
MTAEELAEALRLLDHPDLSEETKRVIRSDLFPVAMQEKTLIQTTVGEIP